MKFATKIFHNQTGAACSLFLSGSRLVAVVEGLAGSLPARSLGVLFVRSLANQLTSLCSKLIAVD